MAVLGNRRGLFRVGYGPMRGLRVHACGTLGKVRPTSVIRTEAAIANNQAPVAEKGGSQKSRNT
jgi:hypothetical protein